MPQRTMDNLRYEPSTYNYNWMSQFGLYKYQNSELPSKKKPPNLHQKIAIYATLGMLGVLFFVVFIIVNETAIKTKRIILTHHQNDELRDNLAPMSRKYDPNFDVLETAGIVKNVITPIKVKEIFQNNIELEEEGFSTDSQIPKIDIKMEEFNPQSIQESTSSESKTIEFQDEATELSTLYENLEKPKTEIIYAQKAKNIEPDDTEHEPTINEEDDDEQIKDDPLALPLKRYKQPLPNFFWPQFTTPREHNTTPKIQLTTSRPKLSSHRPKLEELFAAETAKPRPFNFPLKGNEPSGFKKTVKPEDFATIDFAQIPKTYSGRINNIQDILKQIGGNNYYGQQYWQDLQQPSEFSNPLHRNHRIKFSGTFRHPRKVGESSIFDSATKHIPLTVSNPLVINQLALGKEEDKPDPLYKFKPQSPSDVNLMAVEQFRFAPEDNSRKIVQHAIELNDKLVDESIDQSSVRNRKPISVMLDIYPIEGSNGQVTPITPSYYTNYKFAQIPQSDFLNENNYFRSTSYYNRNPLFVDEEQKVPGRLRVHLNMYPKRNSEGRARKIDESDIEPQESVYRPAYVRHSFKPKIRTNGPQFKPIFTTTQRTMTTTSSTSEKPTISTITKVFSTTKASAATTKAPATTTTTTTTTKAPAPATTTTTTTTTKAPTTTKTPTTTTTEPLTTTQRPIELAKIVSFAPKRSKSKPSLEGILSHFSILKSESVPIKPTTKVPPKMVEIVKSIEVPMNITFDPILFDPQFVYRKNERVRDSFPDMKIMPL